MILDANALIDFHWLNEWAWLQENYGTLFVSQDVLDFDKLNESTKESAIKYLEPVKLDTPEMYNLYKKYSREFAPISIADCSTLAIAKHQELLCGTDDGKMIKICHKYQINYTRTLRLLKEMSDTGYKTINQVIEMKRILVEERGKWIAPKTLKEWEKSL
jgi:predicted nucleic acid-binding protein